VANNGDDTSIPDEVVLWRRVPPEMCVPSSETPYPPWRPSSVNFNGTKLPDGAWKPLSVFIASETTVDAVMFGHETFGLVSITLGQARVLGRDIVRLGEGGPGHCDLFVRPGDSGSRVKKNGEKLARLAEWVVVPPQYVAEFERARQALERQD
jgi:hypothetical protein